MYLKTGREIVVAEGASLDNIAIARSGQGKHVKHGAPFSITMQLPKWAPAAPVVNLLGTETIASRIWRETGGILRDVHSDGFYGVVLEMESNAFIIPAVIIVGLILISIGVVVTSIKMLVDPSFLQDIKKIVGDVKETTRYATYGLIVLIIGLIAFFVYREWNVWRT